MRAQHRLIINTAITSLFALGITASSGSTYAVDNEKCYGITKAGQNGCNSNKGKHTCAGHSKVDNDPNDFIMLPEGSCVKIGGKLEPGRDRKKAADKIPAPL